MKQYLVMGCQELSDQWECDYNKTPLAIFPSIDEVIDYLIDKPFFQETVEVYKFNKNTCIEKMQTIYYNEDAEEFDDSQKWLENALIILFKKA